MLNDEQPGRSEGPLSMDSLSLLEALPPEQRAAVRGRVIEGRDYAELALQLHCSEHDARQRVGRGLCMLRLLAGPR